MSDTTSLSAMPLLDSSLSTGRADDVARKDPLTDSMRGLCRLSDNMKGLLVALFGGGVPAGLVAPFSRMANSASNIPSLEILLFRCLFHLSFIICMRYKKVPAFGPPGARKQILVHAVVNVISIGCAYWSFMVVPTGNAATVRKGSSTVSSTLLALIIEKDKLTGFNCFGLLGSMVGLLIIVVPGLLQMDAKTRANDIVGYILASLGGLALALGLVKFRKLDFESKLLTAAFMFGLVGSILSFLFMFIMQRPIVPRDPLTWTCVVGISLLALTSFLCASYAVTKTHPALVCAVLHSEVVVTMAFQYYMLREDVTPYDIVGAWVIIGSISIITAQNISCDTETTAAKEEE
ncbi:solute carrier family 35 member G3-like [Ambystoma mexicanum]|uniref:solute carrier family 35 member G3-like n=1 Tax=Ambystoma mexicanum TaxID=8296 RepID=UPI0037E85C4F